MNATIRFCCPLLALSATLFGQPSLQVTVTGKVGAIIKGKDPLGLQGHTFKAVASINPVGVSFNASVISYSPLPFSLTANGTTSNCSDASATLTVNNAADQGDDTLVLGNCKLSNAAHLVLSAAFAPNTLMAPIPLAFTAPLLTAANISKLKYTLHGNTTTLAISGHAQTVCVNCPPMTLAPTTGLTFTASIGGAAPLPQDIIVSANGTQLAFYAAAATSTGGNWLSLTQPGGATGGSLSINVNPTGLAAGTYVGTVTVYSAVSNSPQVEPVALVVVAPSYNLLTSPTAVILDSTVGVPPQPQLLTVTTSPSLALSYTAGATTANGTPWLLVSPTSGITGDTRLSVTADVTQIRWGTYQGTITLSATGATNNPLRLPVTLRLLNVMYSFAGGNDGADPAAPMIIESSSTTPSLYGVTATGGPANAGTVFILTPPGGSGSAWNEQVIYEFKGGKDGANPLGSLALFDGIFYGVTQSGGKFGAGTVYSLTSPSTSGGKWTESLLYSFSNSADGGFPQGRLVIAPGGLLYGTTSYGGSFNQGAVFLLIAPSSPGAPWTEKVLHNFGGAGDGANPHASLVMGTSRTGQPILYGTTDRGGTSGNGTVFSMTPLASPEGKWTETVLYNFQGGPDGATPHSGPLILGQGGVLFGTTVAGGSHAGGTVFQLNPPSTGTAWTNTVIYNFNTASGESPTGLVASGGSLFGTTTNAGGSGSGQGTAFELKPPASPGREWQFNLLHTFIGPEGANPQAGVVVNQQGIVYGVASAGGASNLGTIFEVVP